MAPESTLKSVPGYWVKAQTREFHDLVIVSSTCGLGSRNKAINNRTAVKKKKKIQIKYPQAESADLECSIVDQMLCPV